MSKALVTESDMYAIGNAIRAKLGVTTAYRPGDMPAAIAQIGGAPVLQSLAVTSNGEYAPPEGVDGFDSVSVSVSGGGGDWASASVSGTRMTASFISNSGNFVANNSTYPNYAVITIDLNACAGCVVQITNAQGDRNRYNVYDSVVGTNSCKIGDSRISTSGTLTFYADDMKLFGRYLVYDYTSDHENCAVPQVTGWQLASSQS